MTLNCQSYNCIHNDTKGKCFAKVIAIKGRNAQIAAGTVCDSYVPPEDWLNYVSNELASDFMEADDSPSNTQNINCDAINCRYNFDTVCTAINVAIDHLDANCETFRT